MAKQLWHPPLHLYVDYSGLNIWKCFLFYDWSLKIFVIYDGLLLKPCQLFVAMILRLNSLIQIRYYHCWSVVLVFPNSCILTVFTSNDTHFYYYVGISCLAYQLCSLQFFLVVRFPTTLSCFILVEFNVVAICPPPQSLTDVVNVSLSS